MSAGAGVQGSVAGILTLLVTFPSGILALVASVAAPLGFLGVGLLAALLRAWLIYRVAYFMTSRRLK